MISSQISSKVMGLTKDFTVCLIEEKMAKTAKEAEVTKQKSKQEDVKTLTKEEAEHMRAKAEQVKKEAIRAAKSQTVVIGPSSDGDGPGGSDKTPWSKFIQERRGATAAQLPRELTNASFLEHQELDSLTNTSDPVAKYTDPIGYLQSQGTIKHSNHTNAIVASGSRFNSIVDGIFSMIIPSAEASTSVIGPILAPAPMPVDMEFIFDEGYGYTANSDPFEDLILRTAPLMNAALKIQDAVEYVRYVSKLAAKVFAPETLVDSQRSSKQLLDQDIRAKKDAHKISLYSTAKATMTFNQCWIKALPVEGKAQALVDLADGIHGHIDRLLYPYDYVVGTLKHKALHEINKEYQKICNDYTFKSEVAVQNGTIYDERPNLITGASIVDLITALPYAKDTYYAFDAKFGSADVTEASIRKLVKNIAPEKVVIWQVKPSRMSKTEIKYPKFNSINLNQ